MFKVGRLRTARPTRNLFTITTAHTFERLEYFDRAHDALLRVIELLEDDPRLSH